MATKKDEKPKKNLEPDVNLAQVAGEAGDTAEPKVDEKKMTKKRAQDIVNRFANLAYRIPPPELVEAQEFLKG